MKLAELKRRIQVGTMLRKVRGWPRKERQDTLRVVSKVNSTGFGMEGEGVADGRGPSWMAWPKAKELRGTAHGFIITDDGKEEFEYEWANPDAEGFKPSPKDRVVDFLLNRLENCDGHDDAVVTLGESLGDQSLAEIVVMAWESLPPDLYARVSRVEVCDRTLRQWLDSIGISWGERHAAERMSEG